MGSSARVYSHVLVEVCFSINVGVGWLISQTSIDSGKSIRRSRVSACGRPMVVSSLCFAGRWVTTAEMRFYVLPGENLALYGMYTHRLPRG